MININNEQANHLDSILRYLVNKKNSTTNIKEINKNIMPDKQHDYCLSLFFILSEHHPSLLNPIKDLSPSTFWQTDYASAFLHDGGFTKMYHNFAKKEKSEKDRQERKDKSDELDLLIKKWQIKTKYLPYIVSIFALIVSIFSYFKPEKKQLDLQQVQQDLQQLKDHVKSQDSLFRVDTLLKKHK